MTNTVQVSPVALFAYMRPEHLRATVESLRANAEAPFTHVTVFCDAPKRPEHAAGVAAVRAYVKRIECFASVEVIERERNLGLAASIVDGVTRIVEAHGRVIVVEDDLLLSPYFLRYMNEGLDIYANDEAVASIHGYAYPVAETLPDTYFLRGADCWGWATWRRAWSHLRLGGADLLIELKHLGLTHEFDFDGSYCYTQMLRDQIAGRNDSWAVRWHASCYLDGMLTLYPGRSLVHNIGNDASGTHCEDVEIYAQAVAQTPVLVQRQSLQQSAAARNAVVSFLGGHKRTLSQRLKRALLRAIKVTA